MVRFTDRLRAGSAVAGAVTVAVWLACGSTALASGWSIQPTAHLTRGSELGLSQAPGGLRAAVRRTLDVRTRPLGNGVQQAELSAPDGAAGDEFGYSVAIYGSTALVGAYGSSTGAAYVFVRSGTVWSLQAKLTASDAAANDLFGYSVALYGSAAVVGAPHKHSGAGATYVFVHSSTGWSQRAELMTSDRAPGDYFGYSVGIYGSTVVVGALFKNGFTGAAYVFVHSSSGWSQQAKLTASDGVSGDYFGSAVAIYGSTVVVSAPNKNADIGVAYVFVDSSAGWSQQAELIAPDGAVGDEFGFSVAVHGSTVVVGAPGKNSNFGAAYVFVGSSTGWSEQAELTATDAAGDEFGYSVGIYGSVAVVGAPTRNTDTGAAYVFVHSVTGWSQYAELTASDGVVGDYFGWSAAIDGSTAVVGAMGKGSFTGAAYVFVKG